MDLEHCQQRRRSGLNGGKTGLFTPIPAVPRSKPTPMSSLLDIPEVIGLDTKRSLVRIPPELDVPLTARVCELIDTPEYRRLAG